MLKQENGIASASPYANFKKDEPAKPTPRRKDSVGNYIVPLEARKDSLSDGVGPLVERRRSSICMEPPPPSGRRGSVDIFEGAPMGRRASINPNAPKLDPPTIKHQTAENGSHIVTLECKVTSDAEPVCTWFHLDERVKNDERHKQGVRKEADGWVGWLEMREVKMKDAGKYTIRVQNGAGEQYATVFSFVEKNKAHNAERRPSVQSDVKHYDVKTAGAVHINH